VDRDTARRTDDQVVLAVAIEASGREGCAQPGSHLGTLDGKGVAVFDCWTGLRHFVDGARESDCRIWPVEDVHLSPRIIAGAAVVDLAIGCRTRDALLAAVAVHVRETTDLVSEQVGQAVAREEVLPVEHSPGPLRLAKEDPRRDRPGRWIGLPAPTDDDIGVSIAVKVSNCDRLPHVVTRQSTRSRVVADAVCFTPPLRLGHCCADAPPRSRSRSRTSTSCAASILSGW